MQRVAQLPRLTIPDMRDLHRVCGQLDAAAAVLVQSTWQGKFPVLMMLEQSKQTIAALYNRGEPSYLAMLERRAIRPHPEALEAACAKETANG